MHLPTMYASYVRSLNPNTSPNARLSYALILQWISSTENKTHAQGLDTSNFWDKHALPPYSIGFIRPVALGASNAVTCFA
jgi:hypothetical protein